MLKNNSGAALAMVLIILTVGMVIGGVVLFLGTQETKLTYTTENLTRAYYVARSGADAMGEYLINNPNNASDVIGQSSDPVTIGGGEATITDMTSFTEGSIRKIRIVAQGVVPGGFSRTATLVLKRFSQDSLFEYGLFSEENIQGEKIGDVDTADGSDFPMGSNGTISSNANFPVGNYDLLEYQNQDYPEPLFPGESYVDEDGVTQTPIPFPIEPQPDINPSGPPVDITINAAGGPDKVYEYNLISMNTGSLTFKVNGNNDLYIIVSELYLSCPVTIDGGGTVHLYVKNGPEAVDANFQTPINVGGDAEQFRVYLEEDAGFELRANVMSFLYVYGPNADVELGSQFTQVTGAIIAGSFEADGKADITFEPLTDSGNDPAVNGYQRDRWED